ncbi:MAG: aminoglycoside phosphotransferase family protein [Pseudomonadota bacterium]|nr:aminoglycoside phosphotransferase family protein [Pseudomonadota bacterium]
MTKIKTWDTGGADLSALYRVLAASAFSEGLEPDDLIPMRLKGLVHAHVRIRGTSRILRIPRFGAFGMSPLKNLEYQAACFTRAHPSGHVPALHGTISPQVGIPWGALIISEIEGVIPPVPGGLGAMARALAAIHSLPVPAECNRPPLQSYADPVAATLTVIKAQSGYLDAAEIAPAARQQIDEELRRANDFVTQSVSHDMPITLVGTDTHPGNFMMQSDGHVVFVDLEKMLYGAPAIDLAHATVYTSTMWDPDVAVALNDSDVNSFYNAYFSAMPTELGDRVRPWCGPLRRITWLRTTTWCAKLRVEIEDGAAWLAGQHDPTYIAAVRQRIDDYFEPETIADILVAFDED